MSIFLTIDVETDWGGRVDSIRAVDLMTPPLLEMLEKVGAKATFFISSEIAHKIRGIICQLVENGHEVGSHGHKHNLRYDQLSREDFFEQARQSKEILEDIVGHSVSGFRTPQFRKNRFTEDVLTTLGYQYDSSSVMVALPGRYKREVYKHLYLPEFPVSSLYRRLPAGVKWINLFGRGRLEGEIPIVYVHLFDLLRIRDTIHLYSSKIDKHVLLFYLARVGSPITTLEKLAYGSKTLTSVVSSRI